MATTTTTRRKIAAKPLTPEERRGLEDVDELLKQLIKANRRLHARIDKLAHSASSLGEGEVDRLLKAMRKRVATRPTRKIGLPGRRAKVA